MWLRRVTKLFTSPDRLTIVEATDEFGFPHIALDLQTNHPHFVWVRLEPEDAGDHIAQGNKLSEAIAAAFSAPLFGTGLPYSYGLSALRKHLGLLQPVTLALSNAEYGLGLASALTAFSVDETNVVLHFQRMPSHFEVPEETRILREADLKLTGEEAVFLARDRLTDEEVEAILARTDGAYEQYINEINRRIGLPSVPRPSPSGSTDSDSLPFADISALLDSLVEGRRWIEALEVAARNLPQRVPDLIDKAGDEYFSQGLFDQFWDIFKFLPQSVLDNDRVAYWRFSAAIAKNCHRELENETKRYLEENAAPDLRALVAVSVPEPSMLHETERAYRAKKTTVTIRSLGFAYAINGDPATGIEHLKEANSYAKEEQNRQLMVATSNELAVAYQLAGQYREAHRWASWALAQYNDFGMKEELRRLYIVSQVVYPALLIGRVETVANLLESVALPEEVHGIPSLEGMLSLLTDYALVRQRPAEALHYAEVNHRHLPSSLRGYGTVQLVRALVAAGKVAEAVQLAESTYCSAYGVSELEQLRFSLALGTAQSFDSPKEARPHLARAQNGFRQLLYSPYLAEASILLASVQLKLGNRDEARNALARGDTGLVELAETGWHLLGGRSAEAQETWELWNEDSPPLELKFLGGRNVRQKHETRDFPMRWCEILAVLAYHPEGVHGERLALMLYNEGGNMTTIKANLSRLRKEIPIDSRPYRIDMVYRADFVEMDRALREGRVREALELYRGPLLPESEAPLVVEIREHLEESLRQSALASGDVDVLLSLARKLQDDLELWEAVSTRLSQNDPQLALAKAHVKRIQRAWG